METQNSANQLETALTHETPGKILGLMLSALASMMFLALISFTNASLEGTRETFPDPFSQNNVVSFVDNMAASYSKFAEATLINPVRQDFAMYKENFDWVMDNSDVAIVNSLGLQSFASVTTKEASVVSHKPQVAGAYIAAQDEYSLLDKLYAAVTK